MKNTIILFLFILPLFAAFPPQSALPEDNISQQSILQNQFMEELKWLQEESVVSTASRREQKVSETPAAVFVISQEDIRRSGANSIPEVLRMAPGVHVARIDANKWAITMRGFNNRYADKLLVLIDGRTVYTPLFSGTYWDVQD
ncbi:MAG: TonB-dependent receptor plug domain-containing protein, partial [Candidatus Kuenenia stuttgartiensis]|nr:TonB-dependent receptor plug domain-containing protein [Candidatus Kuenenia stuttgartiensis]